MAAHSPPDPVSPWRRIFEDVRRVVGNKRDANGVLGSINWLRRKMEARGANPNVVRNIIYRDKGKLHDKRVLFEILDELWTSTGQPTLQAPELEVLLSPGVSSDQEILQLLGREKRRAYRSFVGSVRSAAHPKMLVTGRPGSGKTVLSDYIQQALEIAPRAADAIVRLDFSSTDLATSLTRLAVALKVPQETIASRLVKIGTSTAYAVQADAQADIARVLLDAIRQPCTGLVLLLHVSQSLGGQTTLGAAPLRLNTPEVPRVSAAEWLWLSLFEPLSHHNHVSLLVSMSELPARAALHLGAFEGPVRLNPPTSAEARRFVKARLPHFPTAEQEAIVQRAGRSFEELRTLTLLAEIREPLPDAGADEATSKPIRQLGQLVTSAGDRRLRGFLEALATLSLPEYPTFRLGALDALRPADGALTNLDLAFLDQAPGSEIGYRCFSRQLARVLRQQLQRDDLASYQRLNLQAARFYQAEVDADPQGEIAARYLHHLFEARDWLTLESWLRRFSMQQSLVKRLWEAAELELTDDTLLERIAHRVASHYVKLGSFDHRDALRTFETLSRSNDTDLRAWTMLKQAEGAVLKGHFERADTLLEAWAPTDDPYLRAEVALVRASIARWRSQLGEAAWLIEQEARPQLELFGDDGAGERLTRAKVAVWAGLIAKDQGDLEAALDQFASVPGGDDLIEARVAFQQGDVLLKLGRFDEALETLNRAVELSHRSEALLQEQTRYLARRGTLYRLRGDLHHAHDDLAAALAILDAGEEHAEAERADTCECDFWRAKVEGERALLLLARGEHDAVIFTLEHNLRTFERYGRMVGVDATYRVLRGTLHLAIAYLCRGLGRSYTPPYPRPNGEAIALSDVQHGQALLEGVVAAVDQRLGLQHHSALRREAMLAASLFAPDPARASELAREALETARFPYQRTEALARVAAAELRLGRYDAARDEVERGLLTLAEIAGPRERGDLGLAAWLIALALEADVALDEPRAAGDRLYTALVDDRFSSYRTALIRHFGEAVEGRGAVWLEHGDLRHLLDLGPVEPLPNLRLPDALVARLQTGRFRLPVGSSR